MTCPLCGGTVAVEHAGRVDVPTYIAQTGRIEPRATIATFVACNACDYCETVADLATRVGGAR